MRRKSDPNADYRQANYNSLLADRPLYAEDDSDDGFEYEDDFGD